MSMKEALENCTKVLHVEEQTPPEGYEGKVNLVKFCYESDGCQVYGYAAEPITMEEKLPVVIFNRGGNREFSLLQPEVICRYVGQGFLALGSQYRGNGGGTGQEQFGGEDVNDVLHLIDIALQLPRAKKGGVYMAGHSRGGMMTYRCCAIDKRIVAAAVSSGVADCVDMYHKREDEMKQVFHELVGGTPEQLPEEYKKRSAVCWADKIMPPILISHGTADWRVDVCQAKEMDSKLEQYGKEHRLDLYEGFGHPLKGTGFFKNNVAWFKEHPISDEANA